MHSHNGYHDLKQDGADADEGVVLLSLVKLGFTELDLDSPISGKSDVEGFEAQDVVGGGQEVVQLEGSEEKNKLGPAVSHPIPAIESGSSSSESDDDDRAYEPLVKTM